jgi:PAS domain S-box-containing protein
MNGPNQADPNRPTLRSRLLAWAPVLIALAYLLVGVLWILLSDRFLTTLASDPATLTRLQTVKGFWYVGITAALLWLALQVYSRNIASQKQRIKTSQERYRSLFTSIHEPILVLDTDKRIVDCNPALEKLFSANLEDLQGEKFSTLYRRREQFQALDNLLEKQSSGDTLTETVIYRKFNRTSFPGETTVSRMYNAEGKNAGFIVMIEDLTARYAAEIAIAEKEEEYRQLFEQAPVGVFQTTLSGQVVDINLRMAEILGYSSKDEALDRYQDLAAELYVEPHRRQEFLELLEDQGRVEDFVYQAYRADGSRIWLSMNARVQASPESGTQLIQGFAADITEQIRADQALKESESRYRRHLEQSFDGIAIHREGRILFINQQGADLLGAEHPEEIIDREIWEFLPDAFHPVVQTRVEDLPEEASGKLFEEQLLRLDGEPIDVEVLGIQVTFQGKPAIQVVFRDISPRKWMESALIQEKNRAQKYLDIAGVLIVALDNDGKITMINETGCEILGYREEELLGRDWFSSVLPPEIREKQRQGFNKLIRGEVEDLQLYASPILTQTGQERIIEWHHIPLHDNQGEIIGSLSSGSDVTNRIHAEQELTIYQEELEDLVEARTEELEARVKEVETLNKALTNLLEDLRITNLKLGKTTRRLQDANQELESFTYSVSHDLRAPLRAINGFSRILEEEFPQDLPEKAIRYLRLIQENAQRMDTLIKDLLALSRYGRQSIVKSRFDPTGMVEGIIQDLLPEDTEREIKVEIDDLPPLHADPGLLRQVFINLIDNALKYTKTRSDTIIKIGTEKSNGETAYYVQDNGIGFNMDYTDKLFGTFQRLHRTDDYQGTGIGLAIVQRIIHKHGGRVWAEGEEGAGAVFYFALPADNPPANS